MFIPRMPSSRLMREYRRKERLELKLAVCKERIRVMEEQERPKYRRPPEAKDNNVPTNKPLTLEQLREMDGEPVWVEDVKHWALIDIEKGGQWDGVPFAIWAENGMKFTYNIKNRGLHCYRRPPEGEKL